jgi:peptidoglycan/LPS O-acetylase OafA/YrhL
MAMRVVANLERNPSIDGLKFMAAALIVLFHVSGVVAVTGSTTGSFVSGASYWALSLFFCVAGYFHGPLGTRGGSWLYRRALRLGVPYAAWSAFYLAFRIARGAPLPSWWRIVFLGGAEDVLWSLPLLLACAALAELFVSTALRRRLFGTTFLIAAIAGVAAASSSQSELGALTPLLVWPFVYAVGMEIRSLSRPIAAPVLLATAVGSILALGTLPALAVSGVSSDVARLVLNTAAAAAVLTGAHLNQRWTAAKALAPGGPYLLGVYVLHVFWQHMAGHVVRLGEIGASTYILVTWITVLGLSVLSTRVLRSSRFTRWAVD